MKKTITFFKTMLLAVMMLSSIGVWGQGTENFTNLPVPTSGASFYLSRTWTGTNGLEWSAADARVDQTITSGNKAICIRQTAGKITGPLTLTQQTAGIGKITFTAKNTAATTDNTKATTYQFKCGSVTKTVTVPAMGTKSVIVESPELNSTDATQIEITITALSGVRVTIDDLSWTAYSLSCTPPTTSFASSNVSKLTTDAAFTNAFTSDNTSTKVWSSTNEAVATVDADGLVTIHSAGTTSIKVNQAADATYCAVVDASYALTVTEPIVAEPTNQPTGLSATANSSSQITVTWTDASGAQVPAGYIVKAAVDPSSPTAPVDGIAEADATLVKSIAQGTQTAVFTGLNASTTYNFSIWPYTNSGSSINYKTDGTVATKSAATSASLPPTVLNVGDIAILQVNSVTTDRIAFVTFVDLNPGTVISFTDNGFTSATTVRTGEGFLIYTAPTLVPAGTVVSWYDGMEIAGTGWSAKISNFILTDGDQLFAYQGTWDNSQTLIYGVNLNAWITSGGDNTTSSYLPSTLTDNVTAFCFSSNKYNAYYSRITNGASNVLKSLITHNTNWKTATANQGAQSWTFSLGTSTTLDANTSVYNLTIATGETLTINPAKQLTISGTATNNGTITIKSNENGTGTIVGDVSGNATVQQYLPGDGRQWWYLSTPVHGATTTSTSVFGTNKVGQYNEATTTYSSPFAPDTELEAGKGYVVKLPGTANGTYTFSGTLNNGDYILTPTRTGVTAGKRGFNLVGNPYPSYLDWDAAYADASNVRNAIWYRTYSGGQMTFHTYADADGVPEITTGMIPPAQAFWIRVDADGSNGSITFKNTHRSHAGETANPLKAPKVNDRARIRLRVSNGVSTDEALIVAKSHASNGIDSYDIEKMSNDNVEIPEIYTLLNNQDMVINSFSSFVAGQEIALGMRPGKAGDFTINATQFENIPSDIKVILKDKFTGAETELSENASYSFNADGNEANQRFSLLFRAPGSVTGIDNAGNNTLLVYAQQSEIVVNSEELKGSNITVYTATGQSVLKTVATGNREVLNGNFTPGVYFVKVNNTVKKVSVK